MGGLNKLRKLFVSTEGLAFLEHLEAQKSVISLKGKTILNAYLLNVNTRGGHIYIEKWVCIECNKNIKHLKSREICGGWGTELLS